MLRSVGINVTEEGMARFRKRLREAEAKWTPEARAALLEQLGLGWRGRTSDRADMDAPNHFPSRMTLLEPDRHADADAVLRAAGINVTEQGKARWRVLLREAAAKHTPEARAKWRAQAGLPTESA
jgi:hypothetical protein